MLWTGICVNLDSSGLIPPASLLQSKHKRSLSQFPTASSLSEGGHLLSLVPCSFVREVESCRALSLFSFSYSRAPVFARLQVSSGCFGLSTWMNKGRDGCRGKKREGFEIQGTI